MALHLIVATCYSGLPKLVIGVDCIKLALYHEALSFVPHHTAPETLKISKSVFLFHFYLFCFSWLDSIVSHR